MKIPYSYYYSWCAFLIFSVLLQGISIYFKFIELSLFFYKYIYIMAISFYLINHLLLLFSIVACLLFCVLSFLYTEVNMTCWCESNFSSLCRKSLSFFWNLCFMKWQTTWFTLIDEINMCRCHHSYSNRDVTGLVQIRNTQWLWPDLPCCVVWGLVNRTKMLPTCCIAAW
mgnify:CR=1 FL=1